MAEKQLRQDIHGCYYWADPEQSGDGVVPVVVPAYTTEELNLTSETVPPTSPETVKQLGDDIAEVEAEIAGAVEPPKRSRGKKAAAQLAPTAVPPPPPPIPVG